MTVHELTSEQLFILKQNHLCKIKENVSWDDLANADKFISNERIIKEYKDVWFVEEDFLTAADCLKK